MLYEIVLEYSECKNQEVVHIDVITPPPPPHPNPPTRNPRETTAQHIPNARIKKVSTLTLSHTPPHPNPPTRNPRERYNH